MDFGWYGKDYRGVIRFLGTPRLPSAATPLGEEKEHPVCLRQPPL